MYLNNVFCTPVLHLWHLFKEYFLISVSSIINPAFLCFVYMATYWTVLVYKSVNELINVLHVVLTFHCPIGRLNVHDCTSLLVQRHHVWRNVARQLDVSLCRQAVNE